MVINMHTAETFSERYAAPRIPVFDDVRQQLVSKHLEGINAIIPKMFDRNRAIVL